MTAPQLPYPPSYLPPEAEVPKRRKRWPWVAAGSAVLVAAVLAVLAVTLWSSPGDGSKLSDAKAAFKASDPNGYKACDINAKGRTTTDKNVKISSAFDAADYAKLSTNPAISAAIEDIGGGAPAFVTVDLEPACAAAGYPMPKAVAATN